MSGGLWAPPPQPPSTGRRVPYRCAVRASAGADGGQRGEGGESRLWCAAETQRAAGAAREQVQRAVPSRSPQNKPPFMRGRGGQRDRMRRDLSAGSSAHPCPASARSSWQQLGLRAERGATNKKTPQTLKKSRGNLDQLNFPGQKGGKKPALRSASEFETGRRMLTKLFHNLDYKAGCEHPRPDPMPRVHPAAPPRTSPFSRSWGGALLRRVAVAGGFPVSVLGCSGAGIGAVSVAVMAGGGALTSRALPRRR